MTVVVAPLSYAARDVKPGESWAFKEHGSVSALYEAAMPNRVTIVARTVAEACGLTVSALLVDDRRAHVVRARHAAWVMAREFLGYSQPKIAKAFGGRNHTSVTHAEKIWPRTAAHPELAPLLPKIRRRIKLRLARRRAQLAARRIEAETMNAAREAALAEAEKRA